MPNVKFLLLLHHKEFLNAGNSAKILLSLLPKEKIELYVYGREGDFDRLIEEILMDRDHTLTLWPGGDSQTIEEFLSELPSDSGWAAAQRNRETELCRESSLLKVVVLDGTYTNAKNMHKTIRKRLKEKAPKNVALYQQRLRSFTGPKRRMVLPLQRT